MSITRASNERMKKRSALRFFSLVVCLFVFQLDSESSHFKIPINFAEYSTEEGCLKAFEISVMKKRRTYRNATVRRQPHPLITSWRCSFAGFLHDLGITSLELRANLRIEELHFGLCPINHGRDKKGFSFWFAPCFTFITVILAAFEARKQLIVLKQIAGRTSDALSPINSIQLVMIVIIC